jgi:hypothetical protein
LFAPRTEYLKGLHFSLSPTKRLDESAASGDGIPVIPIDNAWKKGVVIAGPDGTKLEFYAPRAGRLPDVAKLPAEQRLYLT